MMDQNLFQKFGQTFQTNEIIFCEFEPGNDFYLIQKGKVRISKIIKDTEKTMDVLKEGDIFGEMAILEEQPRSATAMAVELVETLHFDRSNFSTLMSSQPEIAFRLILIFGQRIYDAKRRLMILLLDDIAAKVADVCIMLAEKENSELLDREIVLPVTVDDIASWCAEPLSNIEPIITSWSRMEKIELYTDKILIRNLNDMRRIVASKRNVYVSKKK